MRLFVNYCLLVVAGMIMPTGWAIAQLKCTTTILLMRHAEKESIGTDPELSPAGKKRAAALPELLRSYVPDEFYSTDTRRTKETLAPWARARGKQIRIYNAALQEKLASKLKSRRGKTIIVVGHSNTIPGLANLILETDTFSDLPESEYGSVWFIRIRNGKKSFETKRF